MLISGKYSPRQESILPKLEAGLVTTPSAALVMKRAASLQGRFTTKRIQTTGLSVNHINQKVTRNYKGYQNHPQFYAAKWRLLESGL